MKALSFLGTTDYQRTSYFHQGKSFQTEFFAQALPHFFPELEEILVFVTPQVREHPNLQKLKERVKIKLSEVEIPAGQSEGDLWMIFDALTGQIQAGERVLFDITNSYRSLPFLVFLAAAFLRTARGIDVAGVIYGAYDARDASGQTPVFDLTPFVVLLDWLAATNRFVETGDGHALADLLQAGIPSGPRMGSDLEARALGKSLKSASEAIRSISMALRLTRPVETMQSAAQVDATITQAMGGILQTARPFSLLAEQVTQEYGQFALEEPTTHENIVQSLQRQLEMINWYINRRHVIQASTLAREWIISLLAWKLGAQIFDYNNGRGPVEQAINNAVERRKIEPNLRRDSVYDAQIEALPELDQICKLWSQLSGIRNDIAHCGMRPSPAPAHLLKQKVESLYPQLLHLAAVHLETEK